MRRILSLTAALVALALTAPATATWGSAGDHEPDNPLDVADYVWPYGPNETTDRIYFNVYAQQVFTNTNPNVGALQTRIDLWPWMTFEAHFGLWVDCNGDGYIGLAESAAREYRNELLTDKTLCPPESGNGHNPPAGWNWHNYNGWVTELIPIGRGAVGGDKRLLVDHDAKVWGDRTVPYPTGPEHVQDAGSGSCPISPLPEGTWATTGGVVDYVDCFLDHELGERYNQAVTTAGRPDLALDNSSTWKEPGHPLNMVLFGSPRSEDRIVTAQDCSATPIVTVGQFTTGTAAESLAKDFATYGVRPPKADPNEKGSVAGTYNATEESIRSDCNPYNDDKGDFYRDVLFEGEHEENSVSRKISPDYNFNFTLGNRGGVPLGMLSGKEGAPSDGGFEQAEVLLAQQSEWIGGSSLVGYTPDVTDGDLTRGSVSGTIDNTDPLRPGDTRIANATFFTFYAYVSSAITGAGYVTPGGSGIYGAPFCPTGFGTGAGTHYGWECEKDLWYTTETGKKETHYFPHAYPGDTYQFRDVDCFDGGVTLGTEDVNAGEVGVLPSFYGPHACRNPPPSTS